MRFLFAKTEPRTARRVLVVQTANPDLFVYVLRDAREFFPEAEIAALVQKGMDVYLPDPLPADRILNNEPMRRRELIAALRVARYDAVCVIESGETGFWKLKLLPVLLNPPAVWVYDRRAAPRALSLSALLALSAGRKKGAAFLTPRRLAAPGIFLDCWRFFRRRRRALSMKGEGAHRLGEPPPR